MNDLRATIRSIDVAVCTFRRSSVQATLRSIADQQLPLGVTFRLIVADNDTTPSAEAMVTETAGQLGLDYLYIHAPERNISTARNACLDNATAPLIAFIDDDELAGPGWLATLLAEMDRSGADVVLGPAHAEYPVGAPAWVENADLHSTRPAVKAGGAYLTGYTCNVLFRRAAFAGQRFDLELGRTGGEDDVFFSTAVRNGAKIAYAQDAAVRDPVPIERAKLSWLCRRAFRNGQTYARNTTAGGANRIVSLFTTSAKAACCLIAALATLPSAVRWRKWVVRGALHVGACAGYLGWREIRLY